MLLKLFKCVNLYKVRVEILMIPESILKKERLDDRYTSQRFFVTQL